MICCFMNKEIEAAELAAFERGNLERAAATAREEPNVDRMLARTKAFPVTAVTKLRYCIKVQNGSLGV